MIAVPLEPTFDGWRAAARSLLAARVPADRIRWVVAGDEQGALFAGEPPPTGGDAPRLPPQFFTLARSALCFDAPDRFSVPYRVALRLADDRTLLDDVGDDDVLALRRRGRAAHHDIHQMHAFLRFKPTTDGWWVAFHRPEHWIVHEAAPHFVARFGSDRFAILGPRGSVVYQPETGLVPTPAVQRDPSTDADAIEALWLTYYASIYNPTRPGVDTMNRELPLKHRATMPETAVLPMLLRDTPARLRAHADTTRGDATPWLPEPGADLERIREALDRCRGCELHAHATRAVMGEGAPHARIVLVGEQPGDREDLAGRPFVGPAGRVLDQALEAAALERRALYLTNAVKHFRNRRDGYGRRLHETPDRGHVEVCRPWLLWELGAIRPTVLVALGATAARSLLGRAMGIHAARGRRFDTPHADHLLVGPHPSAVLRSGDGAEAVRRHLVETLVRARELETAP